MEHRHDLRPGEYLLNRFVPHLTGEDRERARERLVEWAKLLVKIARRMVDEDMHTSDSHESDSKSKIQPTPSSPS